MNIKDLKFYIYDKGTVRVEKPDSITVHYNDVENNYAIEVTKAFKTQSDGVTHVLTYKGKCSDNTECERVGVIDRGYNQFYWVGKNARQVKEFLTLIKNKLSQINASISETLSAVDILLE